MRDQTCCNQRVSLPISLSFLILLGPGLGMGGKAVLDWVLGTQTNGRQTLSSFPANADALLASALMGRWEVVPCTEVPTHPDPPFATL